MNIVAIPDWNSQGFLPPADPTALPPAIPPNDPRRSPYPVSLMDLMMRFASTPDRWRVLHGFLAYRQALHALGLVSGFQWLDGSFVEDVETLEQRAPRDIDVVSFVEVPARFAIGDVRPRVLNHDTAKADFKVDAFFVELNRLGPEALVSWSAYWYSVWSHRRNRVWKGFLQVQLGPDEDANAKAWLEQNVPAGVSL